MSHQIQKSPKAKDQKKEKPNKTNSSIKQIQYFTFTADNDEPRAKARDRLSQLSIVSVAQSHFGLVIT